MPMSQSARIGGTGLVALVATYGIGRLAYGLFVPRFQQEFGLSLDVLGLVASAAQAAYLLATVATGVLAARFGPRLPVVCGCLVLAGAAAVTASAPGPWLLAAGIVGAGASAGGTWAPFSDAIEEQVPSTGRRRALALVNAGAPVGLVLASVLVLIGGEHWRAVWWMFGVVGLLAAGAAWRVLDPSAQPSAEARGRLPLRWLVDRRSARLLVVTLGVSVTSGAYFTYAPDTAEVAGLGAWIGPAMWAVLGITGTAVGIFGGGVRDRFGLRWPLTVSLLCVAAANVLLLLAPDAIVVTLASAAVFGVGFTTSFALVVIWSQQVFDERPTTGFTLTIVIAAAGFIVGPGAFGVLATNFDRAVALVALALPAAVAAFVSPSPTDRDADERADADRDRASWRAR